MLSLFWIENSELDKESVCCLFFYYRWEINFCDIFSLYLSSFVFFFSLSIYRSGRFFSLLYSLFHPIFSSLSYLYLLINQLVFSALSFLLSYLLSFSLYRSITLSLYLIFLIRWFLFTPISSLLSYLLSLSLYLSISLSYLYILMNQIVSFHSCNLIFIS